MWDEMKIPVVTPSGDPIKASFARLILHRKAIEKLMRKHGLHNLAELSYHTGLSYFGLVRSLGGKGWNHKTLARLAIVLKPDAIDNLLKWQK